MSLSERLRRVLQGPLPGLEVQRRMAPRWRVGAESFLTTDRLRPAAGLIALYPEEGRWYLPLTQRGTTLRQHRGQVSLPGGRMTMSISLSLIVRTIFSSSSDNSRIRARI